jgi:hypothetical protein
MSRGSPLLRRAPGRLLHSGSIAGMILISVALLAGLVSAGPLFGSATNAAGLAQRLSIIPETTAPSKRPVVQVTMVNGPSKAVEPQVKALVDGIPYLGDPATTVVADAWELDSYDHPTPYLMAGNLRLPGVLYYRTGAVEALEIASGKRGAPGIWLPAGPAKDLGLRPGSKFALGKTYRYNIPGCGAPFNEITGDVPDDTATTVTVAGTYKTAEDGRLPLGSYFSRISSTLPSDPGHCSTPASMLIGDQASVDAAIQAVEEIPVWTYLAGLTPAGRTPAHLAAAAAGAARLRLQAAQPGTPIAKVMTTVGTDRSSGAPNFKIDSGLANIHQQAVADAEEASRQGRGIAYAGGILGLAAVVVALRALAQRRRREAELLLGLGTPTRVVIGAGTIELLLPVIVGAAAGWAAAVVIFGEFGPHPQYDSPAVRSAGLSAVLVALVALLANALVGLSQARQISRSLEGRGESRFGSQWLPLLTGATVLAVIATLARERDQSHQDPMAALLPILVLACGCSLIARGATAVGAAIQQRRVKASGHTASADRLVLRGLRRTGVAVTDLVIVLSIGVGVLAYGLLSAAAVGESVTDKAAVLAGAQSTAHIRHSWLLGGGDGPSPKLPAQTTVVWRGNGLLTPDNEYYDLLVVDPTTFAAAAEWGSGPELAQARAALADLGNPKVIERAKPYESTPIPALLVGASNRKAGETAKLRVTFKEEPIEIRRRLSVFPGAVKPTLVLDSRSYFPRLDQSDDPSHEMARGFDFQGDFLTWIWTRTSMPDLLTLMSDHGLPTQETLTLEQARATPVLASARWAAAYQVILGLAAAALAGLAVVVAVDRRVARAAPVDLMLRRFGIRPARLLALRTTELAVTGLAALAVLIGPLALMVVLLPRLIEPDPGLPPSMPIQVTAPPLLLAALAAVIVTVLAALVAARRSATLKPGEVLRDDT